MNRFLSFLTGLIAILLLTPPVAAQSGYVIKGTIVDQSGPVIGATVLQKGTSNGTSTDVDGKFQLTVPGAETVIEISCIGYKTLTYTASSVPAKITMQTDSEFLDDVVVIGYGTVKKDDMTGSVSTVKADNLNKGVVSTPADLLRGKTSGVVVTSGNGQPGSGATIRVRGGSSLTAVNDPLIVVDGLPISNTAIDGLSDPLSSINPSDIESFTVLKDASATAIYGSRASNGVIVITTKKGSRTDSKVPHINLDFASTLSQIQKYVDVMDADQLRNTIKNIYGEDSDPYKALGNASTDWQKEIYRLAQTYEGNLSLTGRFKMGNAGYTPYRISGGYLSQEGIIKTGKMNRSTVSVSLTPTLLDDHLTIALNGKGMYTRNSFANQDAITNALHMDPTKPVYDDVNGLNGYTIWKDASGNVNTMAIMNPVALLNDKKDFSDVYRFIGNSQINYKVHGLEDLSINVDLGMDWAKSTGWNGAAQGSEMSWHDKTQAGSGYHADFSYLQRNLTLETYVQYSHDFNAKHHFDIMGGYSWQHFYKQSDNYSYKLTDGTVLSDTPKKSEYFLVSFFGRANYTFDNKYMFTATIRRDGTSRFSNNQWGLFPSVALGWNIAKENFLKDNNVLSALKLRLSWGQTGQQDLNKGDYPTLPTYQTNLIGSYYYFGDNKIIPLTALGYNADLKWETTTTWNAGLDYGFLDGRIWGGFDVYYRKTSDLINFIPVPALSNLNNYLTTNIGDLENKGVEFEINAIPIQTRDWSWTIGANVSYNKNKITKLTASSADNTGVETGDINGGIGNKIQMHQVGYPTSAFYVYQQVYDANGKAIEGQYVDRNNDGKIDTKDKYYCKKPAPDVTVGLNTTLSYKNWTLAASGHGSFGNWVYYNVASENEMLSDLWTNSFVSNRLSSATETNFTKAQYMSDYYLRNGSFFKIDNITLGYTFPKLLKWTKQDRNLGLNIYFTVQNVYTITGYDGIDPEIFDGIDRNIYPRPRNYILGVKFNF